MHQETSKAINGNGTSSSYLMNGNEKYVNSGWILPKGQSIATHMLNAFTLTFTKPEHTTIMTCLYFLDERHGYSEVIKKMWIAV